MIQGMIHSNTMMHGTLRNSLSLYGTIKPETVPRLIKISGLPPLTYIAEEEGTLKNYRIYGQTVDGESVGDRTGNLFDIKTFAETCFEYSATVNYTNNTLTFTATGMDAYVNAALYTGVVVPLYYRSSCIDVLPSTTYTISMSSAPKCFISWVDSSFNVVSNYTAIPTNATSYTFTTPENCTKLLIRLGKEVTNIGDTFTISDIMLNEGSTALPYGYKVPVTVEGKNLCNNIWEQKMIDSETGNASPNETTVCCDFIPVKPNVTYSCSRTIANNYNNLRCYGANKDYLGSGADLANKANPLIQRSSFGTFMITDARVSYIRFNDFSNSLDTKYMLVEGAYTAETMPTYEPYHAPITTPIYLPEPIKMVGDEAEYIDFMEQKQHRVRKNLLPNTATSQTINGVEITINANGSVTCNGQATEAILFKFNSRFTLPVGEFVLTGCPTGGGNSSYRMYIQTDNLSPQKYYRDLGNGVTIDNTNAGTVYSARISITAGYSCNNLTFYPMIRLASIEDDTYEPYIENTDLDVTLPALPTLPGTNTLSVGTEVQPSEVEVRGRITPVPTGGGE